MSLLDTERKIRKIRNLLRGETDPALASRLATDYAEAVRATQLRLQQCETMIQAGDYPQVIQLAETAPNLLDMVTALEFRESPDWRRFCLEKQLAVAEPLDSRAVQALNECYAKGIATDHPLYGQFRKAMMSRDNTAALRALRSILRLNRNDQNAAAELERLDAKVLGAQLAALHELMGRGSPEEVQRAVAEIEEGGFKTLPDGPVWQQAQLRLALQALDRAGQFRADGDWNRVMDELDLLQSLVAEHKLTLPSGTGAKVANLDAWLKAQQAQHRQEMEFRALQAAAWSAFRLSEDHATSGEPMAVAEIKGDLELLQRAQLALERIGKALPAELATRFGVRCRSLDGKLRSRRRRRLIVTAASFLLILGLLGTAGYYASYAFRVQRLASELNALIQKREVKAVTALLKHLQESEPGLLVSSTLKRVEMEAKDFVTKELQTYSEYTNALRQLPTEFKSDQLEETQSKIKKMVDQLASVAPALRLPEEGAINELQERWRDYLETCRKTLNGSFEPLLLELEQRTAALAAAQESSRVRSSLPSIDEFIRKLNELGDVPSVRLEVQKNWRTRFNISKEKYQIQRQRLDAYEQAVNKLYSTQNLEEFRSALATISSSGFEMDKVGQAAAQALPRVPGEDDFLSALLFPNDKEAVRALKQNPAPEFVPKDLRPEAIAVFRSLRSQPALSSELIRYRLYLDVPTRSRQVDWISVGPLRKAPGWETNLVFPADAGASQFQLVNRECFSFDGKQMRIPRGDQTPVVEVEEKGPYREASSYQTLRLGQVFGMTGDTGTQSLLKVLDALRMSEEGSPLARAYLLLQMIQLMEMQPADWGLIFAPIVREWQTRLREAGAEGIKPGDWFVPERIATSQNAVAQSLASLRSVSCVAQAHRFAGLLSLTLQSGISLIGYVGLDGQPVVATNAVASELWGVTTESRLPSLLYRMVDGGKKITTIANGLPLTPLLKLNASPVALQKKAQITSDEKAFLPLLYKLSSDTP